MRVNRFVFLNRPMLSLEAHLGVTASPQAPFPTDYVTLPVSGKSPPFRLTPSRSLIVAHIFCWTRDAVSANLFACWLRAVTFPKRY